MKYIFIHGLGQDHTSWDGVLTTFNHKEEAICVNLKELVKDTKITYSNLYNGLEKYLEQFDEPFHLCGLSLGGTLALDYTINHPNKVGKLVLIGAQYKFPKLVMKLQNIVFKFLPKSQFKDLGFRKEDYISICKSIEDIKLTSSLNSVTCTSLIICGKKDKGNKKAAKNLNKMLPNSDLIIIPNTKHEVNTHNPQELVTILNKFFNQD